MKTTNTLLTCSLVLFWCGDAAAEELRGPTESEFKALLNRVKILEQEVKELQETRISKADLEAALRPLHNEIAAKLPRAELQSILQPIRDDIATKVDGRNFKLHPKGLKNPGWGQPLCLSDVSPIMSLKSPSFFFCNPDQPGQQVTTWTTVEPFN